MISLPIVTDYISFEVDWPDFRVFAIYHHKTQMYGQMPYSYHLATVESILVSYGFNSHEYRAAAWLHDLIEDTEVTADKIYRHYGNKITSLVVSCTGVGKNRKERNAHIYKSLKLYPEAAPVKVADRIANLAIAANYPDDKSADKIKMYLKEWPEFRDNIKPLMFEDAKSIMLWDKLCSTVETLENRAKKESEAVETAPLSSESQ